MIIELAMYLCSPLFVERVFLPARGTRTSARTPAPEIKQATNQFIIIIIINVKM